MVIVLTHFGRPCGLLVLHLLPNVGGIPPKNDGVGTCYGQDGSKHEGKWAHSTGR